MSASHWIGVDLGGTKVLAGVFDEQFQLLGRQKIPTGAEEGPAAVLGRVGEAVQGAIAKSGVERDSIRGLGLGVPGQVIHDRMMVRYAPNLNWNNQELQPLLPSDWSWPVVLENDVRVGTYGEYCRGAARGARHVLGIFVGTGIGGGLILDGKIYHGFHGNAGEIGHIIVHWRKGHTLEKVAGRKSLMKKAGDLLADAPKSMRKPWKSYDTTQMKSSQLAELVGNFDPIATQLMDDCARAVGATVGSMANLLSPEVIVLGGGVSEALGEDFRERIWEFAQRFALPGTLDGVRFELASLGDDAGIIGAAALARDTITGT